MRLLSAGEIVTTGVVTLWHGTDIDQRVQKDWFEVKEPFSVPETANRFVYSWEPLPSSEELLNEFGFSP